MLLAGLWKTVVFGLLIVAWWFVFYLLEYDPTKTSPLSPTYDPTKARPTYKFFSILFGLFGVMWAIFINYCLITYRRTSELYENLIIKLTLFASDYREQLRASPEARTFFTSILNRFSKILAQSTEIVLFEGYSVPLPVHTEDSIVSLHELGRQYIINMNVKSHGPLEKALVDFERQSGKVASSALKAFCSKNNKAVENTLKDFQTIIAHMTELQSIHKTPVPVIIHRIYVIYTIITYGLMIPYPWFWLGWICGTILDVLILTMLIVLMDTTKRITSIFDPISWYYAGMLEQTTKGCNAIRDKLK